MQDHNKPKGIRGFLRDYGYYLVIGACALAIGVSGYLLVRGGTEEAEPTLNVPVRIETEETQKPQTQKPAAKPAAPSEPAEQAMAETPEEPKEEPKEESKEEAKPRVVVSPVEGEVLTGHCVASLAYNATTRDWRTHTGIDFAAAIGTTVAAAEDGTVSAVYEDDYLGTTVELMHPSGYTTVYSNLQEMPPVEVGQTVCAGDPLGTVGATALLEIAEPPHLHFAVRNAGADVDPAEYLS